MGSSNCASSLTTKPKMTSSLVISAKFWQNFKKNDLTEILLPCDFPGATTPLSLQSGP